MPRPARELTPERSARHLFGAKLRKAREDRGLSLEALASKLTISKSHLARVEIAEYMPPPELPAQLDRYFETDGTFTELYALCTKEAHPDQFKRRMDLEAQAVIIREYSPQIVPDLLQTEDYGRAQFRTHLPKASDQEIEELWTLRLGRQALLLRSPRPDYSAILDEAVLRRSYGGPRVMREQLEALLGLCLTPTSFIQVLPFSHGGHALAGGSLSLWTLDSGQHVAYEESISSGTLLEEKTEVLAHVRAYDLLSASALSPSQSADLIQSVLEALPDEHHP
ncbi:Scr1 family TA system antitoxin-like transcriptional regulator [Streptomyces sp. NPDC057854]|uniref:helix-turn-helix domain-containing protein n=1 Tax=Streptomyces sp. NPDC057854 TaxID=3346264 RepID=UPI0036955BC6